MNPFNLVKHMSFLGNVYSGPEHPAGQRLSGGSTRSALFSPTPCSSSFPPPAPLGPLGTAVLTPVAQGASFETFFHRHCGLTPWAGRSAFGTCALWLLSLTPAKRVRWTPLERDAELGCGLFCVFAFQQDLQSLS